MAKNLSADQAAEQTKPTWYERQAAKANREAAASKKPPNASSPALAVAQLKKLDEKFGKGVGAKKERARLAPIVSKKKSA